MVNAAMALEPFIMPSAHRHLGLTNESVDEHWVISTRAVDLADIYRDTINIAIWQQAPDAELVLALAQLDAARPDFQINTVFDSAQARAQLRQRLPDFSGKDRLLEALSQAIDLFSYLFDQKQVGFRFNRLDKAMCPRFHVDNIPVRLVQTLGGPGTEWLPEFTLDRSKLGRGSLGRPDHASGVYQSADAIRYLQAGDIALLKGCGWEGNEERGLVHRSPSVPVGESRWFLSLDLA